MRKVLLVSIVLLVGACGDDGGADAPPAEVGDTAVWRVDEADPPNEAATSFTRGG